jgi:hypothetical protein
MLDQALRRLREDGIHDAEKLSAMEAEVSGLRPLLGEASASVQKAARDMDMVRAAVTDQRVAHGRDICAVEEEMGRMGKAIEVTRTSLGQPESEWKAAIGDLNKKATPEQSEVSGLKDVLGRLDGKREELPETVAGLQEAITAGGSKVKEDLGNLQGELAKMKEEIWAMKLKPNASTQIAPPAADAIVLRPQKAVAPAWKCSSIPPPPPKLAKQFLQLVKKGMYYWDVPDGIIAHLTKECGGNVHDHHVVEATCGSFEEGTLWAGRHSGAYSNHPMCVYAYSDVEINSRINWMCYDFRERRIVPTHYTIRTFDCGPGEKHLKSWVIDTSADGKN